MMPVSWAEIATGGMLMLGAFVSYYLVPRRPVLVVRASRRVVFIPSCRPRHFNRCVTRPRRKKHPPHSRYAMRTAVAVAKLLRRTNAAD